MTPAMMAPRFRLMFTDRIVMGGKEYCEPEEISNGYVLHRYSGKKRASESFTHAELFEASKAPDWRFEPEYFDSDKIKVRENSTHAAMHESAAAESRWVYFKWQCVTRFSKLEAEGKTNRSKLQVERVLPWITRDIYASEDALAILERKLVAAKRPEKPASTKRGPRTKPSGRKMQERFPCPAVRTFLRWLSKFEKGGLKPWALRDNFRACGRTRKLCEKQIEYVAKYAHQWLEINKVPLEQIHGEMKDEIEAYNAGLPPEAWISCPSKDAIRRFVRGMSKFRVYALRYGEDRARAKFVLSSGGPEVVRPGQRVEIDHYKADLMTILRREGTAEHLSGEQARRIGRMELCVALDVATRCILGAHLSETPTAADGRRVLRMAVSDKTAFAKDAGADTPWDMSANMEMVPTDAGPAFIDTDFTSTVYNLGATHLIPPGASPWLRGPGERVFQTIHTDFLSRFKGRTFGNYMKRRGHKPEDFAHLTVDELAALLTLWIVDVYHNTPHDGLGGETPRNAWKRLASLVGVRPLPDRRKIRAIFGERLVRELCCSPQKPGHFSRCCLGRDELAG